ncbi:MAG TPA: F0F1 ATP synthase subunit A [Mycobacteriales bacterium]|nr:F0F1 ATP synthase subunit A [Mycobacteriales bacterium]
MRLLVLAASGDTFQPPSSRDFVLPPIFGDITKPMLLAFLSVVIIATFFLVTARRAALVPGRLQFTGEGLYNLVRNGIARDVIGQGFERYVPYLVALFTFILVNNLFGIVPFIQFPTMSRIAFPAVLAVLTWLIFNYVGVRRAGIVGYLKTMMFPPGVPWVIYPLVAPLEFAQAIIVRPLTLALRLFANMFAGHLLLLVFILGGDYLLHAGGVLTVLSGFSFLIGIVMTFFEALVQVLQAYIFTLLTALYVAGALAEEH